MKKVSDEQSNPIVDVPCRLRAGGEVQVHLRLLDRSEIGTLADLANDERAAIALCVDSPEGFDIHAIDDESYQALARAALNLNIARAERFLAEEIAYAQRDLAKLRARQHPATPAELKQPGSPPERKLPAEPTHPEIDQP